MDIKRTDLKRYLLEKDPPPQLFSCFTLKNQVQDTFTSCHVHASPVTQISFFSDVLLRKIFGFKDH